MLSLSDSRTGSSAHRALLPCAVTSLPPSAAHPAPMPPAPPSAPSSPQSLSQPPALRPGPIHPPLTITASIGITLLIARASMNHPMTDYFRDDVLAKRPYLQLEWCVRALSHPVRTEVQPEDGRVRHWIHVAELGRWLRVVTLPDGVTLHNEFPTGGSSHETVLRSED